MLTPEQKELRKGYLTGSDIGAILGVNKWKSAVDVYMEKLGLAAEKDLSANPRVKFGSMAEELVIKYFEAFTPLAVCSAHELESKGWNISSQYPWMAANIDGIVFTNNKNYVFEAKTAGSYDGWGEQGEFIIPEQYLAQIAHYCIVTQSKGAYIAVLFTHTLEFRWYLYKRNPELETAIIKKEKEFWYEHVQKQIPPEPRNAEDVNSLCNYMTAQTPVVASGALEQEIYNYVSANKQLKIWQDMKDRCKDAIARHMGSADTVLDGHGKVLCTYKFNKGVSRLDSTKLKEEQPDVYAKYTKLSEPVRTISVKVKCDE